MITIELFYDCLSPFSYLAFLVLTRYESLWGVKLELRPVLLGGIMASTGNVPPMARPWAGAAAKVAGQDMARCRDHFNTNMLEPPSNFFGPDGPSDKRGLARDFRYMRCLSALSRLHPQLALRKATKLVFEQIWAGERDPAGNAPMSEAVLHRILRESGLSVDEAGTVVANIAAAETKAALRSNTEDAVQRGAFGAPFIAVRGVPGHDEEMVFFGRYATRSTRAPSLSTLNSLHVRCFAFAFAFAHASHLSTPCVCYTATALSSSHSRPSFRGTAPIRSVRQLPSCEL